VDGTQVLLLVNAEDIRFFNSDGPDKEQTVVALASVEKDFGRLWKAGLAVQYLYQDLVFDVSTTEIDLKGVKVQAHGVTARPSVRRELGSELAVELESSLTRQSFIAPLDDYWEGGPKLTLEHEYKPAGKISLSYEFLWRDYETRTARTIAGDPLAGVSLSFMRQDWQLAWQHRWDRKQRWRTTTRLGFGRNTDSGSGYFDYNRYRVSQQLRYVTGLWEAKVQFRFDHYYFPVQTAVAPEPTRRTQDRIGVSLLGERKLGKSWKLYVQFDHEQSLSNRPREDYFVNTVSLGVDWAF
jgi:hypothetical protein